LRAGVKYQYRQLSVEQLLAKSAFFIRSDNRNAAPQASDTFHLTRNPLSAEGIHLRTPDLPVFLTFHGPELCWSEQIPAFSTAFKAKLQNLTLIPSHLFPAADLVATPACYAPVSMSLMHHNPASCHLSQPFAECVTVRSETPLMPNKPKDPFVFNKSVRRTNPPDPICSVGGLRAPKRRLPTTQHCETVEYRTNPNPLSFQQSVRNTNPSHSRRRQPNMRHTRGVYVSRKNFCHNIAYAASQTGR
jgi:hypothetical protein